MRIILKKISLQKKTHLGSRTLQSKSPRNEHIAMLHVLSLLKKSKVPSPKRADWPILLAKSKRASWSGQRLVKTYYSLGCNDLECQEAGPPTFS